MKSLTCLAIVLLFFIPMLLAQNFTPINSGEIIEQGGKLTDSGQYQKALLLYAGVSRNDTNYVKALLAKAMSCEADSQYDQSIKYCQEALGLPEQRELEPEIYNTYGNTLHNLHKYAEAIKIFDAGLSKYPAYSFLLFNKGVVYMDWDSAAKAEECLEKTLIINPYLYSAHYELGLAALRQGKVIPAFLSFVAYLLVNPQGKYESRSIALLSEITTSVDEILEYKNKRTITPDENYQAVEDIVLSKIALDNAYKPIIALDDPISRQIQVVFEKLDFKEDSHDFWIQYYLPFFKEVYSSGKFELFINHSFSNVDVAQIREFNKKRKKEIDAFIDDAATYFNLIRSTRELMYKKRDSTTERYFFENGSLVGKGAVINNGKTLVGLWHFYYPAGNLKSAGEFNNHGDKDGDWTFYYYSGRIKATEHFKNGKIQGRLKNYYENGVLSSDDSYTDDLPDGLATSYYYAGTVKSASIYKMGKAEGAEKQFYANGTLLSISNYSNNLLAGSTKTFYKSGQLKEEEQFVNGKLEGIYKSYYEDGTVSIEGQLKNGKTEGEWKYYHPNGKLKGKRNFINDAEEDGYEEYFDDGKTGSSVAFKKGKINGQASYYDKDGKLYARYIYDNGKIVSSKYVDKSGHELSSSTINNDLIDIVSYTPSGFKKAHRYYDKTATENGPDTLFYSSGKINEVNSYISGELNGTSVAYYRNGRIKHELSFKDGKEEGLYKSYFFNGSIESLGWFGNGQAQGEWLYYDEGGKLTTRSNYLNGDLSGYREEFLPNGKKTLEQKYTGGWLEEMTQFDSSGNILIQDSFPKCTGKFLLLFPNKQKMVEANYIQGDFDGAYTTYFFDGSTASVEFYKKGLKDSLYNEFYYGGVKGTEGRYQYGKKNGPWSNYTEDGKLSSTTEYVDDQMNGTKKYYLPDGTTDLEASYKDDVRNGIGKKYDPNGNLAYEVLYEDDDAIAYSYLGPDNKLVPFLPILPDKGVLKSYFPNGNLSRSCVYTDGKSNGPDLLYYLDGKISSRDTTSFGMYEGVSDAYYEDGKLKSTFIYVDDNTNGICREFYKNGMLKEEIKMLFGIYHGEQKHYDEKGTLTKTYLYYYGRLIMVKNEK